MTRKEAIYRLQNTNADEFTEDEIKDMWQVLYGREPNYEDGNCSEWLSLLYAIFQD